ncbi:MAG TPA: Xaa-Pro dipeptidase [Thermoanaerobaculia bacterium]|jgi:Xaa-Pro dipeptidase
MTETDRYRQHLDTLDRQLARALETAARQGRGYDAVVFHSGRAAVYHRDDEAVPFRASAHFRRWTPLDGPEHVVLARPGARPRVVRVRPRDYWYDTSPPPPSYWEEAVDLAEVGSFKDVKDALDLPPRTAYVGPTPKTAEELGLPADAVEPEELMAPLDWLRAYKTEHELSRIARAAEKTAGGHERARKAFKSWSSEREIYWAYLEASDQLEIENPYVPIVALDEKAAILHYQEKRGAEAAPGKVLLIDAGGACEGYAADVTRTWAQDDCDGVYLTLLEAVDRLERELVAMVTPGRPYLEIHLAAYRGVSRLLVETGLVRTSVDEAVERRITSAFFPHGVGHQIGLQVHDVGGHQAGPEGGKAPPPEEHPFLRNTRILEPGHVVTIEPGLYFISMLLEPWRAGESAAAIDWALVDRLTPHGGIRIEDNVVCTDGEPRDLTRPLLAGPRGE